MKKLFVMFLVVLGGRYCLAGIIDPLDSTSYLTAALNSAVTANGDSTVSMTITAAGDSVVNWYDYSYIRLRNYNDRVEVVPTGAVGSGQYSMYILYFDNSKQFLAEIQWLGTTGSTNTQVLESVTTLAAENSVTNAEYYWLRFRLHGDVGEGFIFDEIRVKEGPGHWTPTALTTAAPKAVFGHEMTGFRTPEYSGYWQGWNTYSHDPTTVDANGKPDIASVCYPSVGYYDMADPYLVEYHCQSFKMARINGVIFDLAFYDMDTATVNMISDYLDIMADYGLQAVICYEDKAHWLWDFGATTRAEALARAYDDMNNWLALFIASGTQYNVTGTRPLFLLFSYETDTGSKGISCLSPAEITDWLNTFASENKPVMMRQWFKNPDHVGILNGQYGWPMLYNAPPEMAPYVGYCDIDDNNGTLYDQRDFGQYLLKNGLADFHMPGVWPGFDDYAVWGWGGGPRLMPRYDGQLYQNTWNYAIDDNLPVIQIATWNDWFETTIIEPAVEFGNQYLEITFMNTAEFKNLPNSPVPDFNVPIWIYKLRDTTSDSQVLADLNTASNFIKNSQFTQAEQIVQPWAEYFDIDSVTYWTGSGSVTTEPNIYTAALVFGTIPAGTTDTNSVIIENTGTEALSFVGGNPIYILAGQTDFSIAQPPDTGDLPLAQSRPVQIEFHPQSTGAKTGVLRIVSNDQDSPVLNVNLSGNASMAGDYYPDGKVDMKDFSVIAAGWQDKYSFADLKSIADNWLD